MIPVNRPLRECERALLDFLLSADFPGCEELRAQAATVFVVSECNCGCGTVDLDVPPEAAPAGVQDHVPIEAYADAMDVLLFAPGGKLGMLEIAFYPDPCERPYPRPDQLKLWARPANITPNT
jgi:hypothetical protein